MATTNHASLTSTDLHVPKTHATSHVDGTDDIRDATASLTGLATATQITKLDGIAALATKYPDTGEQAFLDADHTKLDAIEEAADVTDATNVAAAGAVMDVDTTIGVDTVTESTADVGVTIDGVLNKDYIVIEPPSSGTLITAAGGITVTRKIMRVSGDGGAIDITADPQIVAGTDGQIVIVQGTHDTNTVTLDNGTGLALSAQIVLAENDNITLMYDTGEIAWIETSRTTVT